jgi:uncharacterized protein YjiS (DUF1127 family)
VCRESGAFIFKEILLMGKELFVSLLQVNAACWEHQMNIKSNLMKARRQAMSAITFTPASPASSFSPRALFRQLFAAARPQGRLYRGLRDLPDHLLLDIGVDPRDVPVRAEGAVARPDSAYSGLGVVEFRTAAKS